MDSLRLEKSYRAVGTELSIEYAAYESGLHRFINMEKNNFIGQQALMDWKNSGFFNSLVTLEVFDTKDADALGNNPILLEGNTVGRATSGGFGFRVNKSLALAMVNPSLTKPGTNLEINILGKLYPATVLPDSPYDPKNQKILS